MTVNDSGRQGFRILFGVLAETAMDARGYLLEELPHRDPYLTVTPD